MNSFSLTRRSHARARAVTRPTKEMRDHDCDADGFADLKSAIFPTVTQRRGAFPKQRPTIKPTTGTPKIAPQIHRERGQSFSRNRRRLIAAGSSRAAGTRRLWVTVVSFISNFFNPTGERGGEKARARPRVTQEVRTPEEECEPIARPGGKWSGAADAR